MAWAVSFHGSRRTHRARKIIVGLGEGVFAVAQGHFLHDDAALPALDTPHSTEQDDPKTPERNELKPPLGEVIGVRRRLVTSRAYGFGPRERPHGNLDALPVRGKSRLLIDEPAKAMAAV